jgi:hypothetical protein
MFFPDPYGKMAQYETAIARSQLNETDYAALEKKEKRFNRVTTFFVVAGTLMLAWVCTPNGKKYWAGIGQRTPS